jgi:hypothetical protein
MPRQDNERRDRAHSTAMAPMRNRSPNELGANEAYAFWQGMRDWPRSLGTDFLAGFLEDIFGIKPKPTFQDARLEAVRRLTVCFRHGLAGQLAVELPRARMTGLTENQIAALRSRIGRSPFASG